MQLWELHRQRTKISENGLHNQLQYLIVIFIVPIIRYGRQLEGPNESRRKSRSDSSTGKTPLLTRSRTTPYNKDVCFFCDGPPGYRRNLHNISTLSAGESLKAAVKLSGNDKLAVKLNTSIAENDAHSIDIKYHKNCWNAKVTNVLRRKSSESSESSRNFERGIIAAQIEFLTMADMILKSGEVVSISQFQEAFENIMEANNVDNPKYPRRSLKQLLICEIPDIEFHTPKRVNEPERVSIKKTRDAAIQMAEEQPIDTDSNTDLDTDFEMKTLFDAAAIIRKSINNCKKWKLTGSLETPDDLPPELYSFYRWVIQGPNHEMSAAKKSDEVHKRAMALLQTTIYMGLTNRQVENKKSLTLRSTSDMPQQLAVGLAVHQAVRSKELVQMLHGFGMSVDYDRILRVESQIEASVIDRMDMNDGIYIPPDNVLGRHVFFAVDNSDFAEDTPDGKNTFHGTAMAIYQRQQQRDRPLSRSQPY